MRRRPRSARSAARRVPIARDAWSGEGSARSLRDLSNDTGDDGPDVFTPGRHWEYDDTQCTQGQKFFAVDECMEANPRRIWEWRISACHHPPTGDIDDFDCDEVLGLVAGLNILPK